MPAPLSANRINQIKVLAKNWAGIASDEEAAPTGSMLSIINELLAAIELVHPSAGKPDAWQYRVSDKTWTPCEPPTQDELRDTPEKFRPLYAQAPAWNAAIRETIARALCALHHGPNVDWPIGIDKLGYHQEPYVKHIPSWEWFHGADADAVLAVLQEPSVVTQALRKALTAMTLASGFEAISAEFDFSYAIDSALSPPPQQPPAEPDAWFFELATARNDDTGEYANWVPRLTFDRANVPAGSIRNMRPLYAHPPAGNAAVREAAKALEYLADNDRPQGGQSRYNAEHLIGLAQQLRALQARKAESGWQSMETAPTDGSWVLVWEQHINDKYHPAEVARFSTVTPTPWRNSAGEAIREPKGWMHIPAFASTARKAESEAKWTWLPIDHRPLKTGKYLVGHRGHQEIMHFFGPEREWMPGTAIGWHRLTDKGWVRDEPAERFRATHCIMIEAPGPSYDDINR